MQVVPVEEPPSPALEAVVRAGTVAGARAPPPLHEICDALKRNLGLDGTFSEVINAACLQLGVPPTGGLREKGNACWRAMVVGDEEGVITEQPSASEGRDGGRGSIESLGRYDRLGAIPIKFRADAATSEGDEYTVGVGFGRFIDALVQQGASSGIMAISRWSEMRDDGYGGYSVTAWGVHWSTPILSGRLCRRFGASSRDGV